MDRSSTPPKASTISIVCLCEEAGNRRTEQAEQAAAADLSIGTGILFAK